MGEETKGGLESDFLARLKALSEGTNALPVQQLETLMKDFPEDLTIPQLKEMVYIASEQCGIWGAEYLFSPANAPNLEAKAQLEFWRGAGKSWRNVLAEHIPDVREKIEERHIMVMLQHNIERSVSHNRNRPLRRSVSSILSGIAMGLNKIGFKSVGEHLYLIALYPKGMVGRSPDIDRK